MYCSIIGRETAIVNKRSLGSLAEKCKRENLQTKIRPMRRENLRGLEPEVHRKNPWQKERVDAIASTLYVHL